jgi:MYXO-CTERM domain-containing protein
VGRVRVEDGPVRGRDLDRVQVLLDNVAEDLEELFDREVLDRSYTEVSGVFPIAADPLVQGLLVSYAVGMRRFKNVILVLLCALGANGALAFETQGPEWDIERGPIIFRVHQDGSDDVGDGSDLEAVRSAFGKWSCIEGSGVRFVEGPELTERSDEQVENEIHVFFDETGQFGLDEETRSRSFFEAFLPDQFSIRDKAVIILNGLHFNWNAEGNFAETNSDIESMLHIEIAVVMGLDVCEGDGCPGGDVTVLSGFIPAGGYDGPRSDDEAGIRELYGVDDGSSCEGPFRVGEVCACTDDCVEGNVCAPAADGELICTPSCDSDDISTCAIGYGCLMRLEGEGAAGFCAKRGGEGLPIGTTCNNDSDCSEGLCIPVTALARNVCRVSCEAAEECPADYECNDGACVFAGDIDGEPCGCGCEANETSDAAAAWVLVGIIGLVAPLRRRRK